MRTTVTSGYLSNVTRRSFLKGLAAAGGTAAIYGCSGSDDETYIIPGGGSAAEQSENIVADIKSGAAEVWAGTAGHNCGGRCVTRAVKKNGKIIRILTDENYVTAENEDHVSNVQSRACSRCRSYVGRLYHPGRMKYPLKQTKSRGDLTGFVRISWEDAMMEVAKKYSAIVGKYGEEAIYNHMSSGQQGPFNRAGGMNSSSQFAARVGPLSGGYLHHANSYSQHQYGYFTNGFTGVQNVGTNAQSLSTVTTTHVLWGSHSLSTSNSDAFSTIKAAEDLKARGGKIYHINPTCEDTGITLPTDWIQLTPGSDVAFILGVMHELLVNSFNTNGTPKSKADAWLDIDYIDMMVYGFFDSPEYWINAATGDVVLADPSNTDYTKVEAVPAGRSLASYILGSDGLPNANYGTAIDGAVNYMSGKFSGTARAAGCSYITSTKVSSTAYYYKKDILKAKNTTWAQGITGIPAATITAFAQRLSDEMKSGKSVYHQTSNGWQRRADGVYGLFAVQSLAVITKAWGRVGSGFSNSASISAGYSANTMITVNTTPEQGSTTFYKNNVPKIPSCTIWHDGLKFGFDIPGYTGAHIPGYTPGKGKSFIGDANIKSLIKHKMAYTDLPTQLASPTGTRYKTVTLKDKNGDDRDYYDWEGSSVDTTTKMLKSDSTFTPVGIRFIFTMAGNAVVNQHMNTNDTTEMLSKLPIVSADDANVADCFCYIALDTNFSPTMRWADYAFPGAANWEFVDLVGGAGGAQQIYMPAAINPPGEAKSGYELARLLSRSLGKVNKTKYGRLAEQFDNGLTPDDYIRTGFDNAKAADPATYSKWNSFEEYQKSGYLNKKHSTATVNTGGTLYSAYVAHANTDISKAFIKTGQWITTNTGASYRSTDGNAYSGFMVDTNDPKPSGRFHVYSGMLVWEFEHRNEKFHGYLPPAERGNKNEDNETDPIVYPIPMYFDNRDYYKEAYGTDLFAAAAEADKPLYTLGNHNRYRSHSTFNDSPLLRELGKAAIGGGIPLDTNDFANVINYSTEPAKGASVGVRRLGTYDNKFGYERLWMNPEDAQARDINNGDLVIAQNPIGKVRAVAFVTPRVSKGTVVLPQGGWSDPAPDGVDDGGCSNTICASFPSRCDHGNAQMSVLTKVSKA